MSGAVVAAGFAGALAVLAAWEALGAFDGRAPLRAVRVVLRPLRRGGEPTVSERRRLVLLGAATLAAAGWLVAGPVHAVALGAAAPWVVGQVLVFRRRRRAAALAQSAPVVARTMADALAGGRSIRGALAVATDDGGAELRAAAGALALGEPTDVVLERLRREAADPAWDTLVAAVLLQREAGGDLATLLRELAERLEEARRSEADARSATAQARFTAWLVAALPAVAAGLAELGSPGYLASLAGEPLTGMLVAASVVLQLCAVAAIRRIARVA